MKFHDGSPLNAAIVRDSLREAFSGQALFTSISFPAVEHVETEGNSTIAMQLAGPEAFFLADLSELTIRHPKNRELGTGPYIPRKSGSNQRPDSELLVLDTFNHYYRGNPAHQTVELHRFDDHRAAWAALMRDDIDAVYEVGPGMMDFVEQQKSVRTYPMTRPYYINLLFNMRHPHLRKRAVRQALSHAVDRQHIIRVALNDRGMVAESGIWPQHWAYGAPAKVYGYNTEAARLLLDGAGYHTIRPGAGRRPPSRFRFVCLTIENDTRFEKIALLLQKQLYDIGVDMEVQPLPLQQLGARIQQGDFDALLAERAGGRSLTWAYTTYHSSNTPGGYSAADAVLDRLRHARSDDETRAAVGALLRTFYEDPPAIFLAWPVVARAVSDAFVVPTETGHDVMGSVWQWRPAAPRAER